MEFHQLITIQSVDASPFVSFFYTQIFTSISGLMKATGISTKPQKVALRILKLVSRGTGGNPALPRLGLWLTTHFTNAPWKWIEMDGQIEYPWNF